MSSDDQAALTKYGYAKMKQIDPYHPTVGAVNCDDIARFSDADGGSLLIDYNMQENYDTDIQTSHIGDGVPGSFSGDAKLMTHPLEFEPVINCPWGESNRE